MEDYTFKLKWKIELEGGGARVCGSWLDRFKEVRQAYLNLIGAQFFLKMSHSRTLFRLFHFLEKIQQFLPMIGFEPRTSGVGIVHCLFTLSC